MRTVLIVDDTDSIREAFTRLINATEGLRVVAGEATVQSGLQALSIYKPDLVLLDLRLGHESGLDFLRAIGGRDDRPQIWVMTANAQDPARDACMKLGADDFFDKAADLSRLCKRLALLGTEQ